MIVTLEKEVEEPFDYKGLFLIWLTVLTDYDVSMDMDIETWRAVYDYKEKKSIVRDNQHRGIRLREQSVHTAGGKTEIPCKDI